MCGRFNIVQTPGLDALLDSLGIAVKLPPARCNIAPTEPVPLLRREGGGEARWWLTPSWAPAVDQRYAMFNARCETLATSRAFRGPFRRQRGIVPMSSFLEWRKEGGNKVPWLITNAEEALAVAALWDVWEGGDRPLLSCTLVTTDAAPAFRDWHRRMPVLLSGEEALRWLDNASPIAPGDELFAAVLKFPLRLAPLNRAVGNASRKDPELMAPAGDWIMLDGDH
jgi:putative SOS response-associated peptidase YedK